MWTGEAVHVDWGRLFMWTGEGCSCGLREAVHVSCYCLSCPSLLDNLTFELTPRNKLLKETKLGFSIFGRNADGILWLGSKDMIIIVITVTYF